MSHLTLEVPRDSILNLHSVRNVLGQPELVFRPVTVPCAPHRFTSPNLGPTGPTGKVQDRLGYGKAGSETSKARVEGGHFNLAIK